MLSSLLAAIASGSSGTVMDAENYLVNSGSSFSFAGFLNKSGEVGTHPKAYLNWLVYDKDFNFISSKSGYRRITTAALEDGSTVSSVESEGKPHERLFNSIDIEQSGFVYIYLSNESETPFDVFFDDFIGFKEGELGGSIMFNTANVDLTSPKALQTCLLKRLSISVNIIIV